jgi:hypothetical protein
VLRELEERARVPLSDEAYDAQSDGGGGSLGTDPAPSRVASPVTLATDDDDGHPHVGDTSVRDVIHAACGNNVVQTKYRMRLR